MAEPIQDIFKESIDKGDKNILNFINTHYRTKNLQTYKSVLNHLESTNQTKFTFNLNLPNPTSGAFDNQMFEIEFKGLNSNNQKIYNVRNGYKKESMSAPVELTDQEIQNFITGNYE